jgi:flavodoxin
MCGESMKCTIVYFSRYGNGKKIVEHLAGTLRGKGVETQVLRITEANPTAMPPTEMYVFSAPAEAFNLQMDMRQFMKQLTGMEGRKYGIINTHAMNKNRLAKMQKLLSKKDMVKVAELDFKVVGDTKSGNGLPDGWEARVDEFAKKLI